MSQIKLIIKHIYLLEMMGKFTRIFPFLDKDFAISLNWKSKPCSTTLYCLGIMTALACSTKCLYDLISHSHKCISERKARKNVLANGEKEWVIVYGGNSRQMNMAINFFSELKFNVCVLTDLKHQVNIIEKSDNIKKFFNFEEEKDFKDFFAENHIKLLFICRYDTYLVEPDDRIFLNMKNILNLFNFIKFKADQKSKTIVLDLQFNDAMNSLVYSAQFFIHSYIESFFSSNSNIFTEHIETNQNLEKFPKALKHTLSKYF